MTAIYTAQHLTKKYGGHTALRDVSFSIEPGRLVGLLGPNGAGKSTLIKCSMGLLTPTSGDIIIGGVNDNEEHYRKLANIFSGLKNCLYIELLPYHEYGCSKSLALGREYETFGVPDNDTLEAAARLIRQTAPVKLRSKIYPRKE